MREHTYVCLDNGTHHLHIPVYCTITYIIMALIVIHVLAQDNSVRLAHVHASESIPF